MVFRMINVVVAVVVAAVASIYSNRETFQGLNLVTKVCLSFCNGKKEIIIIITVTITVIISVNTKRSGRLSGVYACVAKIMTHIQQNMLKS